MGRRKSKTDDLDGEGELVKEKKSIAYKLRAALVGALPANASADAKDLDQRGVAIWLAIIHLALYVTLFIYFLSTGVESEYKRKFLALEMQPDSAICQTIPVAGTGGFFADIDGLWSSQLGYDRSNPVHKLALTGTSVTNEQYVSVMSDF